ncbi:MAG: hypothetical protein WCS33_00690 [Candidatus Caldatribacteriota bacterium]|jgi:hypothetical protein
MEERNIISSGMTDEESNIMQHIVSAYNQFLKLSPQHPNDLEEFTNGIHDLQKIIALRIVRRDYPHEWRIIK